MSYCKEFGKDKVIFATKEDHEKPSSIELPETERAPGLILANGEINWNCPCLGGMFVRSNIYFISFFQRRIILITNSFIL